VKIHIATMKVGYWPGCSIMPSSQI